VTNAITLQHALNRLQFLLHPSLLAGLGFLLNTLTLLSEYTPEELNRLATTVPGQSEDV